MNLQERRAEAARLYTEDEQITMREIGQRLGVSHQTIYKDLKVMGVPSRPTPAEYRRQRQAQQFLERQERQRAKEQRREAWEDNHSEPSLHMILRLIDSL